MFQNLHYRVILSDAAGETAHGQYDTYNITAALDEVGQRIRKLLRARLAGKPVGEGWVQLKCLENDKQSIIVGLL
jgi:hypothetical protein